MEPIALLALVLGGLGAAFVAQKNRRERRRRLERWLAAAKLAGLEDVQTSDVLLGAAVMARKDGLEIRIETYHAADEETGTRLTIGGLEHASGALTIRPEGLRTRVDARVFGVRETEVGDSWFDRECFVEGPPALAMATLVAPLRRDIRRLHFGAVALDASRDAAVRGSVTGGVMRIDVPERNETMGIEIAEVLAAVLRIARGLAAPADLADRLARNLSEEAEAGVRVRLVETLAREFGGDSRTPEVLRRACGDASDEVRLRAALALQAEGRATLADLVADVDTNDSCRARALIALGSRADVDSVAEALRRALPGREPATARACLAALQRFRRREAEPLILEALGSPNDGVAVAAALALRSCGGAGAVRPLLALADGGTSSEIRATARQSVGAIQSRLPGAAPGQLTLADETHGALSLTDAPPCGQLSLANAHGAQVPRPSGAPEREDALPSPPGHDLPETVDAWPRTQRERARQ